jgi:hypothetical protein
MTCHSLLRSVKIFYSVFFLTVNMAREAAYCCWIFTYKWNKLMLLADEECVLCVYAYYSNTLIRRSSGLMKWCVRQIEARNQCLLVLNEKMRANDWCHASGWMCGHLIQKWSISSLTSMILQSLLSSSNTCWEWIMSRFINTEIDHTNAKVSENKQISALYVQRKCERYI